MLYNPQIARVEEQHMFPAWLHKAWSRINQQKRGVEIQKLEPQPEPVQPAFKNAIYYTQSHDGSDDPEWKEENDGFIIAFLEFNKDGGCSLTVREEYGRFVPYLVLIATSYLLRQNKVSLLMGKIDYVKEIS